MNPKHKRHAGYTLIELMLSITIISLLASIVLPRYGIVLQKAFQAKAKSNLGVVRTAISIYYSETEGNFPLAEYPEGTSHYTADNLSLTAVLTPRWLDTVPMPLLNDHFGTFNGLAGEWDNFVKQSMTKDPIDDVYILLGMPDYTPLLFSPYAYDNKKGLVYIPNGNYDTAGHYFYEWQ